MDTMTTDSAPGAPGSSNPALEAAQQELRDIATNPSNPRHSGYHKGDAAVSSYLEGLYRKAVPPTAAPAIERPPAQDDRTLDERVAETEVQTMLRQTLGDEYDTEMRYMGVTAQHLFGGESGKAALDVLASAISELGPLAEVRGIRFLAEMGRDLAARSRGL